MKKFSQIVEQKVDASGEGAMPWMAALAQGESLIGVKIIPAEYFSEILNAVESAHVLSAWVALMEEHAREFPGEPNGAELFMLCVEKSPFLLKAWLEAFGYICDWARARKTSFTLKEVLAYLQQCEVQALQKMPTETLYCVVVNTLDLYGFAEL